jgi:threonine/homoserine/homoserine lactone efflux protein
MFGLPLEHLAALAAFAFVASVTPGPNTLMLLASGGNYGFRATIPHMLGICLGFPVLLTSIGFGLGALFAAWPVLAIVLKWAGAMYMLYLAWRIAGAGAPKSEASKTGRPMSFLEAAAFQWVNPKAWVMGVSALATYTIASNYLTSVAAVVLIFGLISFAAVSAWAFFGVAVRRFLHNERMRRVFKYTMALLLVATLIPIFL